MSASGSRPRALHRLLRWLVSEGAVLEPIFFRPDGHGGYTVHVRNDVEEGELIFDIPLRCMITRELARASAIGRAVMSSGASPSDNTALAAFVLEERRWPGSFWRRYLDTLPTSFPHHPFFFTDEELALLEGTFALELISRQKAALAAEYEHLVQHLRGFNAFGYDAFVWARIIVQTRYFGVNVFGEKTEGLVPIAEMVNHSLTPDVHWTFDSDRGGWCLTAITSLSAGQEIHVSYGERGNSNLLSSYGFCLDRNPANETRLRFDPDGERAFAVVANEKNGEVCDMLEFIREQPEPAAALRRACGRALAAFPTTIEEDEALLRRDDLTLNARNAIRVRRDEKRVLQYFLDFVERRFSAEPISLAAHS